MKHTDEAVIGYTPQPQYKVDLVNQNKVLEGYVLDQIGKLTDHARISPIDVDGRMVAIAKTQIEQGFMWLNRAIFQPKPSYVPDVRLDNALGRVKPVPSANVSYSGSLVERSQRLLDEINAADDDVRSEADMIADAEHDKQLYDVVSEDEMCRVFEDHLVKKQAGVI